MGCSPDPSLTGPDRGAGPCLDAGVTTTATTAPAEIEPRPPLLRPRRVLLAGVSAGVARHLGRRTSTVRWWFLLLAPLGGAGVLLYLWLWAFTPVAEPADAEEAKGLRRASPVAFQLLLVLPGVLLVGLVLGVLSRFGALAVSALICCAVIAWSLGVDRRDPSWPAWYTSGTRLVAAGVLLLCALFAALGVTNPQGVATVLLASAFALVALGTLFAPRVVKLWSELGSERVARVKEEQRAEMAAHLHDSVLQTLAVIQNRAGASSEVARLARAQERELRDWLFAGPAPVGADLAARLREVAETVELEHPVVVDVVAIGEAVLPEEAGQALVAATREAVVNAARHAGGDISVYVEIAAAQTEVFVRDRGAGFDLAAVPDGRLGVRESIIGRMQRAGGAATVRSSGAGTEIVLRWPETEGRRP